MSGRVNFKAGSNLSYRPYRGRARPTNDSDVSGLILENEWNTADYNYIGLFLWIKWLDCPSSTNIHVYMQYIKIIDPFKFYPFSNYMHGLTLTLAGTTFANSGG